jgi:hypothetical protein
MYNAMPLEGIEKLIEFMYKFQFENKYQEKMENWKPCVYACCLEFRAPTDVCPV